MSPAQNIVVDLARTGGPTYLVRGLRYPVETLLELLASGCDSHLIASWRQSSTDQQISTIADAQDRVVVTKDADFRNSHLLSGSPRRLLIVTTGNITNDALLELVGARLAAITHAFETSDFVS